MTRLGIEMIGIVLLIVTGTALWFEHDRAEQRIGVAECDAQVNKAVSDQQTKQKDMADEYEAQRKQAEAEHRREIEAIPPRVITTTLRVCNAGPVRRGPVPSAAAQASGDAPGAGGIVLKAGGDTDIRPAIERFKATVEAVVADCRQALAEWPAPPAHD